METFQQWLIIFSGTTISLLGCLLYSSERKLGDKQLEIDRVNRAREKQGLEPHSSPASAKIDAREETKPIGEESDRGRDLKSEVLALKEQLTEKEKIIMNLQSAAASAVAMQTENGDISLKNQRLENETSLLRSQLQTTEQRLDEATTKNKELLERQGELASQAAQSKLQTEAQAAKNNNLLAESDALSSKLVRSEKEIEELRAIQQHTTSNERQLQ